MFHMPRSVAIGVASLGAAASLVASPENSEKNKLDFSSGNNGTLEELVLSGKSFNAISQEAIESAQQSAIKAAQGLKSVISSYKLLVDRFPEIERPEYKDQYIQIRQDIEKLRELYVSSDWDALQKGSEQTIRNTLKLQKSIDGDLARGEFISKMLTHANSISLSYATSGSDQPAVVKEVLQQVLDANQAFNKGASFDLNLAQLEKRVEDLPSSVGYQFTNFLKVAGMVAVGVAAGTTVYYQFPKVLESLETSKLNKKRKESDFKMECKGFTDKLDTLKGNLSVSETMLQQIGQIRYSENRVDPQELDRLSSRTLALHEMTVEMHSAYEKMLAPILKISNRAKAENALRELGNKLASSNLTSDYRQGTILGVGVRASFLETYDAICQAYKSSTADFDKIISALKEAA